MVATAEQKKGWTEEELMSLPDDGNKYELVDEELVMSNAGMEHGYIAGIINIRLGSFVYEQRLGIIFDSSTGFRMKKGNLRAPDVAFVAKERLQGLRRPLKGFFQGSPDLAVEIFSPTDRIEGIHNKMVEYFEHQTRLVWAVNPLEETVLVYHSPQPDKMLRAGDTLDGAEIVPGFSLAIAELFAELEF